MAAPSRFAVKLAVGAVRALEAVEGGGAVGAHEAVEGGGAVGAHEAVEGGGAVGAHEAVEGGVLSRAVGRGVDLSQEVEVEEEVLWAGWGACPHASHALARGAVPATASGPFCVPATASVTWGSSRAALASRQGSGPWPGLQRQPHDLGGARGPGDLNRDVPITMGEVKLCA